jgi:hypothetical protein
VLGHSHPALKSEGMRIATVCHTEMAGQLATLWAAVSSTAQTVLRRSRTKAFWVNVVEGMIAEFQEQAKRHLCLKNSSMRICNVILGTPFNQVRLTDRLEEAIGQIQADQAKHRKATPNWRACKALPLGAGTWCWDDLLGRLP